MNLTTDSDLADQFGIPLEKFHVLRKRHGWPCVRLGRFDYRFTDLQIEQIVAAMSTTTPRPMHDAHRPDSGLTARSAKRGKKAS